MGDVVIKTGDQLQIFLLQGGLMIPPVLQVPMVGKGKATIGGKPVCVQGDEMPPALLAMVVGYMFGAFTIPGTMKIIQVKLAAGNKTKKVKVGGKPLLLKGKTFDIKFQVISPAMQPTMPSPTPDTGLSKSGKAMFIPMPPLNVTAS